MQTVTLANAGGATAPLALPVLTGDYSLASNTCGTTLAPTSTCTLQLVFTPTAAGDRPGTLVLQTVATGTREGASSAVVTLDGQGTPPPSLVLTPTALVFVAPIPVGSTSPTLPVHDITIANEGAATIQLQALSVTKDFSITVNTCTAPLLAQHSCTLSIAFSPTASGPRTGLFTASDGTETHTATLNGTGLAAATDTLSPASLSFPAQVVGSVSPAQSVTLTNSGGATLGAIATQVTGPFIATNNCGTQLGGNLSCEVAVSYVPSGSGPQTGSLLVSDAIRIQPQVVLLNGIEALPPKAIVTPVSLDFGGFAIGVASSPQYVTVANNGTTALTSFKATTTSADFAVTPGTCADTIAAGTNCTVGVTFTAQQVGARSAALMLASPSLTGPLSVALAGSGEDFQLSVTGSSSVLVTNGQTATYHLVVTAVGVSTGTLTITCAGAPSGSICTANPAAVSIAGGATGSVSVSIATGQKPSSASRPAAVSRALSLQRLLWGSGAGLSLLLPFVFPSRARRMLAGASHKARGRAQTTLLVLLALAMAVAPIACGVNASGGSSSTPPSDTTTGTTPPGQYTVTLIGSFPGAQRTVSVTLTVE